MSDTGDRPRTFYWIIESATRGCFTGFDWTGGGNWAPRFRHAVARTDESVKRYHTEDAASRDLAKVREACTSAKAYVQRVR